MEKKIIIDGIEYICTPVQQQSEQQEQKTKPWRDEAYNLISGYYIGSDATINPIVNVYNKPENYSVFINKKLAKRALAMAMISQIMANDERFGGVVTDEEWNGLENKYVLDRSGDRIVIESYTLAYCFIAFHKHEQAQLFMQENGDLVRDYYMLD